MTVTIRRTQNRKGSKFNKAKITAKKIRSVIHKGMAGPGKIHKFSRLVRYVDPVSGNNTITSNAALINYFSKSFALDDIPGVAEFIALFDQYCITKIVLKFYPVGNPCITNATNNEVGQLITVKDYDDATLPTVLNDLLEFETVAVHHPGRAFTLTIRPRVAKTIFRTGITSAYGMGDASTWVDAANTDVPHFGLKMAFTTSSVANITRYAIWCQYYFECRGTR